MSFIKLANIENYICPVFSILINCYLMQMKNSVSLALQIFRNKRQKINAIRKVR